MSHSAGDADRGGTPPGTTEDRPPGEPAARPRDELPGEEEFGVGGGTPPGRPAGQGLDDPSRAAESGAGGGVTTEDTIDTVTDPSPTS